MKGLIYTAIFHAHDIPKQLKHRIDGVQYLLITEGPPDVVPNGWLYSRMDPIINGRWMNRFLKMNLEALLPHRNYDWVMYIDGSMAPTAKLTEDQIETWLKDRDAAFFRHPVRKSTLEEFDFLVKAGGIRGDAINLREFLPPGDGLWAGGMFLRRPRCRLGEYWWQWFLDFKIKRDQLTLPAAIRSYGDVFTVDADVWKNPWFTFTPHGAKPK